MYLRRRGEETDDEVFINRSVLTHDVLSYLSMTPLVLVASTTSTEGYSSLGICREGTAWLLSLLPSSCLTLSSSSLTEEFLLLQFSSSPPLPALLLLYKIALLGLSGIG